MRRFLLCSLWILTSLSIGIPHSAWGQGGNLGGFGTLGGVEPTGQYPSQQYYIALEAYRSGDLDQAIHLFDDSLRGSRRDINGRWIDAIPSLAMLAECNWHLGNLPAAKEHLDHVFQIAIRNRGWLGRSDWQSALQAGAARSSRQGLWPQAAAIQIVPVTDRIMYRSGQRVTQATLQRGGTIQEPSVRGMDIVEIMRGLAIASYRRRVILGALAEQDSLASELLDATKYPAGMQVPLGRTLIGAMRSSEYFSISDDAQSIKNADTAAIFGGGAHPLSAITLLTQTSAIAGTDKSQAAVGVAMNLVHVAAALDQPEFIGEAIQLAAGCCTPQQATSVYQAAVTVAASMQRRSRLATLHCLVAGADAAVTAGDLNAATEMIGQAQSLAGRRDVLQPRLTAYGAYVAARIAAASGSSIGVGEVTDLDKTLKLMTSFTLNHRSRKQRLVSMPQAFQLLLIRQAIGTSLGGNSSDKLLKSYCEDPPIEVWRRDPLDGLAGAMLDHSLAHAARVNLAASGGYGDKVLLAADQMLAARFNQRLPLGGRIAQVRSIARSDPQVLAKSVLVLREKSVELKDVRAAAMAMGQPTADVVAAAEAKACTAALSRLHLPQVSPPLLDEKLPIGKLPKKTGLLSFISIGSNLYACLASEGKVAMWTIRGSNRLPGEISRLLKGIGVGKSRGERLPVDESWKEDAVAVRRHLFPDDATITAERFDELIIVPDGPLWYLPFELLPLGDAESPLIADKITVRYAATPGLALKPVSLPSTSRAIGLASGPFFAPRDAELNASIVDSIAEVLNDPIRLPETVDTPTALLTNKVGHLVVAAARTPNTKNLLLTTLAPYDQNSAYGTIAAWMRFPAEIPRTVVLPGFRTSAGVGKIGKGDELFNTLCALNVAGVRSVLLSRWAVGGESTAVALREFLQELPFAGMNASWSRARMLLRERELDPAAEPLLIQAEHDREGVTGNQPLFWAGYMISSPNPPGQSRNQNP